MIATLLLFTALHAAPPGFVPDARFSLALYCNPTCGDAMLQELEQSLSDFEARATLPRTARTPTAITGLTDAASWKVPDLETLGSLADGLGPQGEAVMGRCEEVLMASFASPTQQALPSLRAAYSAFGQLAVSTGGVVEEVFTSRLFDASSFGELLQALAADPFDATTIYVVEPIEDDGTIEISTTGLRALGLQELRMDHVAPEQIEDMAAVINALAQIAFEGGGLQTITQISEQAVTLPMGQARAVGLLGQATASYVAPRLGGLRNPVALVQYQGLFDAAPLHDSSWYDSLLGMESSQNQATTASKSASEPLAGPQPGQETSPTAPAEAIPAAPAQETGASSAAAPASETPTAQAPVPSTLEEAMLISARNLSGSVRQRYQAGLPAGTRLLVSAPFEARDQSIEYLWVEVESWEGSTLRGTMRSTPTWVDGLLPGDQVEVSQEVVYDYILKFPDGHTEGNLTERFLQ